MFEGDSPVQVKQQVEEERTRLIKESKDPNSPLNAERSKTYDKLIVVQEQLLHHVISLKVRRSLPNDGTYM